MHVYQVRHPQLIGYADVSDGGDCLRLELPAVQLVVLLVDQPVIDGLLRGRLVAVLPFQNEEELVLLTMFLFV